MSAFRHFNLNDSYWRRIQRGLCPNCGQVGAHYVPPGGGTEGFFACEASPSNHTPEED